MPAGPTPPGDTVADGNAECAAMWRACAVGQGAFLREVGHAFGAVHTEGIMMRGYSPDWPRVFLGGVRKVGERGQGVGARLQAVTPETAHDCRWGLEDALKFRQLKHFWLPGDYPLSDAPPTICLKGADGDGDGEEQEDAFVEVDGEAAGGIVRVVFTEDGTKHEDTEKATISKPAESIRYLRRELEERFDVCKTLSLEVTAMNGNKTILGNVWHFFPEHVAHPSTGHQHPASEAGRERSRSYGRT